MEAFVRRLQHWMLYRAIRFAGATTESFEHPSSTGVIWRNNAARCRSRRHGLMVFNRNILRSHPKFGGKVRIRQDRSRLQTSSDKK